MKLLILTPQLPYPPEQGTTIRNFSILKHLAPRHDISLLSFGAPEQLKLASPLCGLCRRIETVGQPNRSTAERIMTTLFSQLPDMALRLRSAEMQVLFDKLASQEEFDVIQVEGIEMAR
jgi:hypothetical protein